MGVGSFFKKYDTRLLIPAFVNALMFRVVPRWHTLIGKIKLRLYGCRYGAGLKLFGSLVVRAQRAGSIQLGNGVRFISMHSANMVGLTTPILLETIGSGVIQIGDGTGGSSLVVSARHKVEIGQFVKLGGNVRIYDHDYHSLDASRRRDPVRDGVDCRSKPVIIGNDVFIGTNSLILKGVVIGDRAIIGAGSVVSCCIPADEIWAGNPARFIKKSGGDETGR